VRQLIMWSQKKVYHVNPSTTKVIIVTFKKCLEYLL
jgi:hypothetical protein